MFGYLWPAYQTFKAISVSDADLERQWCMYWLVFGLLAATSAITDATLSWLPLYWESKFLLVIFLWHPRTKGALYLYERCLLPFMAVYEAQIDQAMAETGDRVADVVGGHYRRALEVVQNNAGALLDRIRAFSEHNGERTPLPTNLGVRMHED
eukprot:gene24716-10354_t